MGGSSLRAMNAREDTTALEENTLVSTKGLVRMIDTSRIISPFACGADIPYKMGTPTDAWSVGQVEASMAPAAPAAAGEGA